MAKNSKNQRSLLRLHCTLAVILINLQSLQLYSPPLHAGMRSSPKVLKDKFPLTLITFE